MKASTKRFLSILVSALMFVAAIFVYSSLILPSYADIKNLRAELAARSKLADEQQSAVSQVQNLLKEYESISSIENTVGTMLPLAPDASLGLSQFSGIATASGLALDSISATRTAIQPLSGSKMAKGVGVLRYSVQTSGEYGNIKSFLRNMETNIALMDLVDLKISAAQGVRQGGDLSFSANINMYYQSN